MKLRAGVAVLLGALVWVTSACQRAAPTPEACLLAAERWHGADTQSNLRLSPELAESVQQMTVQCITQPFDQAFVKCTIARGRSRYCKLGTTSQR